MNDFYIVNFTKNDIIVAYIIINSINEAAAINDAEMLLNINKPDIYYDNIVCDISYDSNEALIIC